MLIFDGIIYSLQRHGGITVYFNELLQRISRKGLDYNCMVYDDASIHVSELHGNAIQLNHRFAERYRPCPLPKDASLFHSSYYRLPSRQVPTVTTVHDFTYERFVKGARRWLHSWQKFEAIRNSQAIICISENTRADLIYFMPDIPLERIHVIHNGVGDAFFPLLLPLSDDKDRPFVLFVGARGGYKHFSLLVMTLARFSGLKLVCVGGGHFSVSETSLVNQKLGGRYLYLSGISDQALNELYNQAYCLVYPSAYEGFGIPVLEAMKAGCPVIAYNGSSIPEVAGDAALLIDQLTCDALSAALSKLECKTLRANVRLKGLDRSKLFSWKETFEKTVQVYELARSMSSRNIG